ncbi:MAG: haloalkane dehalogenase [Acidimicrobiia bacterium]|nr:haloalkane dehalogenase [Acidimicrobiia bacterium]
MIDAEKRRLTVMGADMAYVEMGEGDPIVFLHGNPTSSYLWRTVAPLLAGRGRCIVPDLIGMGDSAKVASGPGAYSFDDHRTYLDAFLELARVEAAVTLVGHDWGGALAFDWADRHREAVAGIVYMETIVMPLTWDDWPQAARGIFKAMRTEVGEDMVLNKNVFVERILPASVLTPLGPEVMDEYRRPFAQPGETRRPTLTWPRQIPIDGEPADVAQVVDDYGKWLATSEIPKLFVNANPGSILVGRQREFCRTWPNQVEVTVPGIHFIQEDSGPEIGQAIAEWML